MTGQTIDRHTISRKSAGVLYRTGVGHYNVTEGRNYWYLTDRAGSTVAVMNDSTVVQRNGYYASGTPFILPADCPAEGGGTVIKPNPGEIATGVGNGLAMSTMTPVADRLHIGNARIGHSGLNLYDNTARLHDPIMVRYHNPDPLAYIQGQISPYTHCNANPANFLDLFGLRPNPLHGAMMCLIAYGRQGNKETYDKYIRILKRSKWELTSGMLNNSIADFAADMVGMRYAVFKRVENGVTEYACAFAGTATLPDISADMDQLVGFSLQYSAAMCIGATLSQRVNDNELTFLGHSKGGGEGIASGLATGREVMAYNPAMLSVPTIVYNGLLINVLLGRTKISNYLAKTNDNFVNNLCYNRDIVTAAQIKTQFLFKLFLYGDMVDVPMNAFTWDAHGIVNMIEHGNWDEEECYE